MKVSTLFEHELCERITQLYSGTRKRRPMQLDVKEGIQCLFKLVRTGMQWRELEVRSVTYSSLFRHVQKWIQNSIFTDAYAALLSKYASTQDSKYYIVDSSHVKNVHGRHGLGRSPVDRGRKGLKVSILTDGNGVVHNLRSDPANVSDFKLCTPLLKSMFIQLRRLEVFADKGYDSKANRNDAYAHGFLPRILTCGVYYT